MASSSSPIAIFLTLNILFFTLIAACGGGCNPTPKPPTTKPRPTPRPTPTTPTTPNTPSTGSNSCPIDTLKLGACANVLSGLLNINLGQPSSSQCCSLIQGIADIDAAVCLCTAIRANILGINLNVPVSLSLLLNVCNRKAPQGFRCA